MNDLVKNAFLMIMGATVAVILYWVFFGNGVWRGVIWFAADAVESSISRYYYEFCYLPNAHVNDYMDESLGCSIIFPINDIQKTTSDLSSTDLVSVPIDYTEASAVYSTGWN